MTSPRTRGRLQSGLLAIFITLLVSVGYAADEKLLGLPELPVPANNPITPEKVALGEKLFNDKRFSSTGKVACSNCHMPEKAFTDSPLKTSKGINDLQGTRNSPTAFNAAYNESQFWDGRSTTLEDQAQFPFINSIEMGLKDHQPILDIVRTDPGYVPQFKKVFGKEGNAITMTEVLLAIATFERTLIEGNSRFDRWYFKGENTLSASEKRGFDVFIGNGRCVSCHMVEHTTALFTDHKFHNIGVGINRIPAKDLERLAGEFITAGFNKATVDEKVLKEPKTSDLGRLAVTKDLSDMGGFKTSSLRNIAITAPYMHDGSLKTLEEVVEHYNRGGASSDQEPINPYLSGGIRPLNLTKTEKADLVAFMKALTSPRFLKKTGKK